MASSATSPPAGIRIRPATAADASAIAQAHYEALDQYHAFYSRFFRKEAHELVPFMTERGMAKSENVFFVAEEEKEGGDVIGFVRYSVEEAKAVKEEEERKKKEEEEKEKKDEEESPYACKEDVETVWKAFCKEQEERDAMMEKAPNGQKHIWVHHLMIRPSHQRKGVGRALLAKALANADEMKLPTLIVSSAESVGLYKKMGFTSLGRYRLDNGHWAREVARVVPGRESEMLAERYDGVFEVEDVLMRGVGGEGWSLE